jgi:hypothetical protein
MPNYMLTSPICEWPDSLLLFRRNFSLPYLNELESLLRLEKDDVSLYSAEMEVLVVKCGRKFKLDDIDRYTGDLLAIRQTELELIDLCNSEIARRGLE